jgi:hypothetical protein
MWRSEVAAKIALSICGTLFATIAGCQSAQVLPQKLTCIDDVQYFPAGPEFQFIDQAKALEEYKRDREESRAKAIRDIEVH